MEYKVGVISGDGIGPEIVTEAKKVLDKIAINITKQATKKLISGPEADIL